MVLIQRSKDIRWCKDVYSIFFQFLRVYYGCQGVYARKVCYFNTLKSNMHVCDFDMAVFFEKSLCHKVHGIKIAFQGIFVISNTSDSKFASCHRLSDL